MLNNLFAKPLKFTIKDQTLRFFSIADFKFCISGRTSVPSSKIAYLLGCTAEELQKEACTIRDIEKLFVAILSRAIEDPSSINRSFQELDTSIFSQDHAWRDIIDALNAGDDEFDSFRKIALVKYMQYLSSRQDIVKYLYSKKGKTTEEKQESSKERLKDTLIFENILFSSNSDHLTNNKFERMPKGEPITVTLEPNNRIIVVLSKHKCEIETNGKIFFIDQIGRKHVLDMGCNRVGRNVSNTIIIDSCLRDVSRKHLIIENLGDNTLQLTDLSAHGTYISSELSGNYTG